MGSLVPDRPQEYLRQSKAGKSVMGLKTPIQLEPIWIALLLD